MNEKASEFYKLQNEMWKEFVPMLIEAATRLHFEHKILKNDDLLIIEFYNKKTDNAIQFLHGYKDALGVIYERFISPVCQLTESTDIQALLFFSSTLGVSVYVDNNLFDYAVVIKYDHPIIGGFPDEIWFDDVLLNMDARTTILKNELNV